jgi:hypothetical protein
VVDCLAETWKDAERIQLAQDKNEWLFWTWLRKAGREGLFGQLSNRQFCRLVVAVSQWGMSHKPASRRMTHFSHAATLSVCRTVQNAPRRCSDVSRHNCGLSTVYGPPVCTEAHRGPYCQNRPSVGTLQGAWDPVLHSVESGEHHY